MFCPYLPCSGSKREYGCGKSDSHPGLSHIGSPNCSQSCLPKSGWRQQPSCADSFSSLRYPNQQCHSNIFLNPAGLPHPKGCCSCGQHVSSTVTDCCHTYCQDHRTATWAPKLKHARTVGFAVLLFFALC